MGVLKTFINSNPYTAQADKLFGGKLSGGDLFGPATSTQSTTISPEQAAFIKQMATKEGQLYPELLDQLGFKLDDSGQLVPTGGGAAGSAGEAYTAQMQDLEKLYPGSLAALGNVSSVGELEQLYPGISQKLSTLNATGMDPVNQVYQDSLSGVRDFKMSPEADNYLKSLRDERVSSLGDQLNEVIGSKVADLAKRGMMSSSTAEGSMGAITKAAAPMLSQINQDYTQQKLALPGQTAKDTFGMASQYGSLASDNLLKELGSQYGYSKDFGATKAADETSKIYNPYNFAQSFGATKAGAINNKTNATLNPLMTMWQNTAGQAGQSQGGTTTGSQNTPLGPALIGAAGSIIGGMASSKEYKKDITPISEDEDAMNFNKVMGIDLKRFKYKPGMGKGMEENREHMGVIAEEAPGEIVTKDRKAVNVGDTVFMLMSAVRELGRQVQEMKGGGDKFNFNPAY